jgi:lactobin A/cerein 7B family class IIb bacteriocin
MKELSKEEIQNVNGGLIFSLTLGVVGGLIGIYELGKALGRLMK